MIDFDSISVDGIKKEAESVQENEGDYMSGLTNDQFTAFGLMSQMYDIFILKGYAGTGKTFLLQRFIRSVSAKRIVVTAPTHKAVGVANGDSTIHSYLSLKIKHKKDKQVLSQMPFLNNVMCGDIVVIDEASMISTELLDYILKAQEDYGLKLIFIGDPCFAEGTEVLMYDGSIKLVDNIVIGDELMGPDSSKRVVLKTCSGKTMLYSIKQRNGLEYKVTPNHKIAFKRRLQNGRYLSYGDKPLISAQEAEKLSLKFHETFGGYNKCIKYENRNIDIDPYYLGFWLGDGDSNYTRLSIYEKDTEVVNFCNDYAKRIGLICKVSYVKEKHYNRVVISSGIGQGCGKGINPLLDAIKKNNLIKNKHIPENYLINLESVRLSVLAGLIDSDGSYDSIGNRYSFCSTIPKLMSDVKILVTQLGFRIGGCGDRIHIYGDISRIPCKIKRKIAIDSKNRRDITKLSIGKDSIGNYFGFEVDGDNLLMLPDGTVVSNCQIPPVGEKVSPVWEIDAPDFTLTEIVRQARDSNIISLATAVREGRIYDTGVSQFINNKDVYMGDINVLRDFFYDCMDVDKEEFPQIISYRNKIVDSSNVWARNIVMDNPQSAFLVGEEVYIRSVGDDQVHKLEDIVKIADISTPYKYDLRRLDYPMDVVRIYVQSYKGEEDLIIPATEKDMRMIQKNKNAMAARAKSKRDSWGVFWKFTYSISEVKHIYSLTCHRSQGSTFKNVAVNCNDISDLRLLYTAITRASEKLFLFRQ